MCYTFIFFIFSSIISISDCKFSNFSSNAQIFFHFFYEKLVFGGYLR